jgi:tetrahydromethanopterin S-methyltransferase subunit C
MLVRIINKAPASPDVIAAARQITENIFAAAGIRTDWEECMAAACQPLAVPEHGDRPAEILLVINADATPRTRRTALGTSLPSVGDGNRAGVFYSRIESAAQEKIVSVGASVAEVLAHVIAHEIGHLLLNWKTHANEGIMRTEWTLVEFSAMRSGKLLFAASEAAAMRRAVVRRSLERHRRSGENGG